MVVIKLTLNRNLVSSYRIVKRCLEQNFNRERVEQRHDALLSRVTHVPDDCPSEVFHSHLLENIDRNLWLIVTNIYRNIRKKRPNDTERVSFFYTRTFNWYHWQEKVQINSVNVTYGTLLSATINFLPAFPAAVAGRLLIILSFNANTR